MGHVFSCRIRVPFRFHGVYIIVNLILLKQKNIYKRKEFFTIYRAVYQLITHCFLLRVENLCVVNLRILVSLSRHIGSLS